MKKRIKRLQITLFILMALAGIALGMGVALLCLNLTTDAKGVSFGGLICLIIVAALCLALPLIAHYRSALIATLLLCNSLFGREVTFLDEDAFYKKHQKEIATVYALRLKLEHGDDLVVKKVYFSLSNALQEEIAPIADIGYTRGGDFIFLAENEKTFRKAMEAVEKKMLGDSSIPPFTLLLGCSNVGEDIPARAKEAIEATMIDSSIRESLSLVAYQSEEKDQTITFSVEKEESMQRLHYDLDEYVHGDERVGLLRPRLYDATRGDIQGKDLFHRCELYRVRGQLDMRSFIHALAYLEKNQDLRVFLRLGMESIENADFLPEIMAELDQKQISASRIVLMINALNMDEFHVRRFIEHARGLGFGIGVYEYGGENVLSLAKLHPEVVSIKTENTRQNADRGQLDALLNVVESVSSRPFVEKDLLGEERSYYQKEVIEPEAPAEGESEQKEEKA